MDEITFKGKLVEDGSEVRAAVVDFNAFVQADSNTGVHVYIYDEDGEGRLQERVATVAKGEVSWYTCFNEQ